jgi:NADH dehydrogenase FAD-containing subunit
MRSKFGVANRLKRVSIIFLAAIFVVVLGAGAGAARAQKRAAKAKAPDLPYTTIDHPQFVPAAQASFLGAKDIVLGVSDGETAKAYPAAILAQHGVVQDQVADGPIAITW